MATKEVKMVKPKQGSCDGERGMDAGELAPLVAEFVSRLQTLGHSSLTAGNYEASARHFAYWLARTRLALVDIDDDVVRRFASHRCHCPGARRLNRVSAKYARRARRFVDFLADCGVTRRATSAPRPANNQRVCEF